MPANVTVLAVLAVVTEGALPTPVLLAGAAEALTPVVMAVARSAGAEVAPAIAVDAISGP